jgi:hypothetical protein
VAPRSGPSPAPRGGRGGGSAAAGQHKAPLLLLLRSTKRRRRRRQLIRWHRPPAGAAEERPPWRSWALPTRARGLARSARGAASGGEGARPRIGQQDGDEGTREEGRGREGELSDFHPPGSEERRVLKSWFGVMARAVEFGCRSARVGRADRGFVRFLPKV